MSVLSSSVLAVTTFLPFLTNNVKYRAFLHIVNLFPLAKHLNTRKPKSKRRFTGICLFVYGVSLFINGKTADQTAMTSAGSWIIALFSGLSLFPVFLFSFYELF